MSKQTKSKAEYVRYIISAPVAKHVSHSLLFIMLYVIFVSFLASYILMWEFRDLSLLGIYVMPVVFASWGYYAGKLWLQLHAPSTLATTIAAKMDSEHLSGPVSIEHAEQEQTEATVFQFHECLYQCAAGSYPNSAKKSIVVSVNIHTNVPRWLGGNQNQLRRVINILLKNAVKYTDKGEISLSAKCLEQSHGKVLLRVEIKDTGIGMSPEFQSSILSDMGNAGRCSDSLAQCRPLVSAMGGQLSISSQLHQGTAIWFTVILSKQHTPELAA